MRRFAQIIRLTPEGAEAYVAHHRAVWPGVLAKIQECHLRNYSIYRRGLTLFAYFEYTGNDFARDMALMASHEETQRWWRVVKPLMQPLDDRAPGEFWSGMEEIFHLE